MNTDSSEIRNVLKTEILYSYLKRFRVYSMLSLIIWPIDYLIAFIVIRYGFNLEPGIAAMYALPAMMALGGLDTIIFGTILRNLVRETRGSIVRMFPVGSSDWYTVKEILNSMNNPAISVLRNALSREDHPVEQLGDVRHPEKAEPSSPEKQEGPSEDGLIDLNADRK
jgi:hypothetical protein